MSGQPDRDDRRRNWVIAFQLGALCLAGLLVYPVVGLIVDAVTDSRPLFVFMLAAGLAVAALAGIVWVITRHLRARRM
jgi:F0F1-type ATP synthase assembly protein I